MTQLWKEEEGTCVRNGLVNCFKRRHSIFNFENNSRQKSGICESERGVLSSPGRAQRVDLGTDKSVHCSLSVYRVAQIFCLGGFSECGDSLTYLILGSRTTQEEEGKEGFTSIPLWPYGAFVNGGAEEEITTFGGGRGAARLLTLLLVRPPSLVWL